jgi:hypothetical protein
VSYLNSAVPYRILNHAGKNSADPQKFLLNFFVKKFNLEENLVK